MSFFFVFVLQTLFVPLTCRRAHRYRPRQGCPRETFGEYSLADVAEFYEQVGARIAAARRGKRKLTQQALASMVSLSRTSIANIEKGRQNLLLHHFVDIADALQVELSDLVPLRKQDGLESVQKLLADLPVERRKWVMEAIAQRSTKGRK